MDTKAQERYDKLKEIVKNHQHAKVDGAEVDVQTANMLATITDNLNDKNKESFLKLPMEKMVDVGWKLIKRSQASAKLEAAGIELQGRKIKKSDIAKAKVVLADSEAVGTPIDEVLNDWRNATHAVKDAMYELQRSHPEVHKKLQPLVKEIHAIDSKIAKLL